MQLTPSGRAETQTFASLYEAALKKGADAERFAETLERLVRRGCRQNVSDFERQSVSDFERQSDKGSKVCVEFVPSRQKPVAISSCHTDRWAVEDSLSRGRWEYHDASQTGTSASGVSVRPLIQSDIDRHVPFGDNSRAIFRRRLVNPGVAQTCSYDERSLAPARIAGV